MLDKNYFPHLLFYGPPGTGKTTSIINLINEYQIRNGVRSNSTIMHLNASDERGIDIIRNQIYLFAKTMNLFESGLKFVILDEVDYMTKNAQQALKYILQTSNYHVRFCLVCNYITKIDESLKNEFICFRFNQLPRQDVHEFLRKICINEGSETLDLSSIRDETLYAIQDTYHSDIRSMINYLQLHQTNVIRLDVSILGDTVLEDIRIFIIDSTNDITQLHVYFRELSIKYNIDQSSMINKFLNYMIRNHTEWMIKKHMMDQIGVIMHGQLIPTQHILEYLYHLFHDTT
jgi:replication factor C subunit 3/5